jgi:hypothetical protein
MGDDGAALLLTLVTENAKLGPGERMVENVR